ncbi:MAG: 4-hydroxy-3-methylbut-2-enyl diphosphate reductase [Bacillota bacterium]
MKKPKEVIVAKSAGFCFGVERAIELAYQQVEQKKLTYTYGSLIHNRTVTEDLSLKGISIIDSLEGIFSGAILIRSHGVGEVVYREIMEKGLELIDGTCPFVKKIHEIVSDEKNKNKEIIILGNKTHPEVEGILGWCKGRSHVIKNVEELQVFQWGKNIEYVVVVQTTFNQNLFFDMKNEIIQKCNLVNIHETICSATTRRQEEAVKLAKKVDQMIVIGDEKSSNTQKLYEICKEKCRNVIHIETISDLLLKNVETCSIIGITAGASTPPVIIKEVVNYYE